MDFNEFVNRGASFFQEGKFDQALENFEKALKLQPDNADLSQMVEMIKTQAGRLSEAKQEAMQAAANEAKHRASVLEALLGIPVTVPDIDNVIAKCTEALKRNPDDASAKNGLASAYYIRGLTFTAKEEHARSIEDYSEAIKNNPDYPLAFNKRGWANLETGNYDQAIEDFEKVIGFKPDDAPAKQNLVHAYMERGIAYDKKGDCARAAADFEMVLKFKPDDNTARELLEMARKGR